jgi:hypothetical protein
VPFSFPASPYTSHFSSSNHIYVWQKTANYKSLLAILYVLLLFHVSRSMSSKANIVHCCLFLHTWSSSTHLPLC